MLAHRAPIRIITRSSQYASNLFTPWIVLRDILGGLVERARVSFSPQTKKGIVACTQSSIGNHRRIRDDLSCQSRSKSMRARAKE